MTEFFQEGSARTVEKVARAIFDVSAPYEDHCCNSPCFDQCKSCADDARNQARAAIGAMMTPSKELAERLKVKA